MEDAGLALWTGTAIGARIGMETDNPEATADLSVMGALLYRSRELDDGVDAGVVYDYLSIYETARIGGSLDEAREYYEHALQLGPERRPVLWSPGRKPDRSGAATGRSSKPSCSRRSISTSTANRKAAC